MLIVSPESTKNTDRDIVRSNGGPQIIKDLRQDDGCRDAVDPSLLFTDADGCEWFEVDYSQCVEINGTTYYPWRIKGIEGEDAQCNGVYLPIICTSNGITVKLDTSSIVELISDKLSDTEVATLAELFGQALGVEVTLADINAAISSGTVAQKIQLCSLITQHCTAELSDAILDSIDNSASERDRWRIALGV